VLTIDDEVPPPATFAFSWLSGLLLYGTPADDGHAARDTWLLTHPDLRLKTALCAGMVLDEAPARELVEDGASTDNAMWKRFAARLMAYLRGLLPHGLDNARPFTALRHAFPEGLDRQTVVFVPGVRGEIPSPATHPFGLTVERHRRAWCVVGVQRKWMMPEWFLDADDELPSGNPL
jgi:hypothetical protein